MNTHNNDEARIRELYVEFERAVRAKDMDRIMAQYAPDVVAFDAVGPLRFKGIDAYRQHWQNCFEFCSGEGLFEIGELSIAVSGDLAFSYSLTHCGGTNENGEMQSAWMRSTRCWRKQGGEWKVAHEHFSMPFDMKSGEVSFTAEP